MTKGIKAAQLRYLQNLRSALAYAGFSARLAEASNTEPCVLLALPGGRSEKVTVARIQGVFWFVRPVAAVTDFPAAVRLLVGGDVAAADTTRVSS